MLGRKWNAVMRGSRVLCVGVVCAVIAAIYAIDGSFPVAAILGIVAIPAIAALAARELAGDNCTVRAAKRHNRKAASKCRNQR
jgi:hypothetical protein